jgi:membrane protein required for colicin V production
VNWAAINDLSLNWVDWVIIVVLTLSTLISLWRGFVREALSLAAWVVAFLAASVFADPVAALLSDIIKNVTGRYIVAYVVLFVGVLVLGTMVNALMAKLIRVSGLSGLDRLLGTIFGFTRGLIIVLVVVFIAQELLPMQDQRALLESDLMPHLEMVAQWLRTAFTDLNTGWKNGISI